MHYDESELDPLPRVLQVSGRVAAITIAAIGALVLLSCLAYVRIRYFGWHPLPSTALGCSIHKRFHSSRGGQTTSADLLRVTDCLKVTVAGHEQVIRDERTIAAIRAWLEARSDLWAENFLLPLDDSTPVIVLRLCEAGWPYVSVDENWINASTGKRPQRPICQGEWRTLAAIIERADP